jgi:hypothetical protein
LAAVAGPFLAAVPGLEGGDGLIDRRPLVFGDAMPGDAALVAAGALAAFRQRGLPEQVETGDGGDVGGIRGGEQPVAKVCSA